jgi:hypothetical protein
MFRSYDHHQGLLLCLCNILLNGVHALLYFGVWPYVIWALYVLCVPFGVRLCTQENLSLTGDIKFITSLN